MNDTDNRIIIRLTPELKQQIQKQAALENSNVSELIRKYIDKGLCIDGYKQELQQISEVTEQSLKNVLVPQIERIIKMLMKIGKIDGAMYFFQLANLMSAKDRKSVSTLSEVVRECNNLAVMYMQQKDYAIDKFLTENNELIMKAIQLKDPYYGIVGESY